MTKKQAKEILLKFVEDHKWQSDEMGFLSGVISTYLEDEPDDSEIFQEVLEEERQEYEDYDMEIWNSIVCENFVNCLKADGLDGDLLVEIDGRQYPLFIEEFHEINPMSNERIYKGYYLDNFVDDFAKNNFSDRVPYEFSNKNMKNIIKH